MEEKHYTIPRRDPKLRFSVSLLGESCRPLEGALDFLLGWPRVLGVVKTMGIKIAVKCNNVCFALVCYFEGGCNQILFYDRNLHGVEHSLEHFKALCQHSKDP